MFSCDAVRSPFVVLSGTFQVECLDEDEPAKTESPKAEEAEGQ